MLRGESVKRNVIVVKKKAGFNVNFEITNCKKTEIFIN